MNLTISIETIVTVGIKRKIAGFKSNWLKLHPCLLSVAFQIWNMNRFMIKWRYKKMEIIFFCFSKRVTSSPIHLDIKTLDMFLFWFCSQVQNFYPYSKRNAFRTISFGPFSNQKHHIELNEKSWIWIDIPINLNGCTLLYHHHPSHKSKCVQNPNL